MRILLFCRVFKHGNPLALLLLKVFSAPRDCGVPHLALDHVSHGGAATAAATRPSQSCDSRTKEKTVSAKSLKL